MCFVDRYSLLVRNNEQLFHIHSSTFLSTLKFVTSYVSLITLTSDPIHHKQSLLLIVVCMCVPSYICTVNVFQLMRSTRNSLPTFLPCRFSLTLPTISIYTSSFYNPPPPLYYSSQNLILVFPFPSKYQSTFCFPFIS